LRADDRSMDLNLWLWTKRNMIYCVHKNVACALETETWKCMSIYTRL
jgi:hypothetical protein